MFFTPLMYAIDDEEFQAFLEHINIYFDADLNAPKVALEPR
jgi:hypothetical protein